MSEAEQLYERVADTAAIAAKPPSQRTEAETERFEKAKGDPAVQQGIKEANELNQTKFGASAAKPENEAANTASAAPEMHVAMATGPGF